MQSGTKKCTLEKLGRTRENHMYEIAIPLLPIENVRIPSRDEIVECEDRIEKP